MRPQRFLLTVAAAAAVACTFAVVPSSADEIATDTVRKRVYLMDNFFDPRSVSVSRGGRVTWLWRGENPHNVVFTQVPRHASKKGATTRRQGRWTRAFRRRGLYKFVCTIHAGMRGTIDVDYEPPPAL